MTIISASYKTDIPAFYGDWFRARRMAGSCEVCNAWNGKTFRVSLRDENCSGFVFWTRNAKPFLAELDRTARTHPFVAQYTVTGYPRSLERSVVTTDAAALADTVAIQVEVSFLPIYKGQPLFANVDTFLREHGFAFHTMVGVKSRPFRPLIKDADPNRGFALVIWSNALYFRDTTGFANLARENPDAVLKIAILAHELYGAFDPAAVALQHYGAAQHQGLATAYTRALTIADPTITAKK